MNRTYLLPVFTTVAALGSACGSSIDGSWDLTRVISEGSTYNYPVTATETYDGITYTSVVSLGMVIDKDETATITQMYSYSVTGQSDEIETYTYNGSWSKGDNKTYGITFSEMDLNMTCTLEDDDLDCDDGDGTQIIFSPADE